MGERIGEDGMSVVENHAMNEVPSSERKGWMNVASIWAGSLICVPILLIGGALTSGLSLMQSLLAGVIGFLIVIAYMAFQGMQGTDLGRPTVMNAQSAFGTVGAGIFISFVLGVALVGWFGVQVGVTGAAFSSLLAGMGAEFPVAWSTLLWGIIMVSTAIIGYRALSYLNYIAVPALILLCVFGVTAAINEYGVQGLVALEPVSPFSLFQGIAMVVGGFAVGAAIAADYSRYNVNRRQSVLSIVVGVLPFGVLLLLAGSIMAAVAGTADITEAVASMGMPALGLAILILATWTTNVVNAYSGGLALTSLFRLKDNKRALTTAVAGGLGTLLALGGILNHFIAFLTILTAGICPLAGVMIADYWIKRKGRKERWTPVPGINWAGFAAWLIASVVSYFVAWGIPAVNGIVAAILLYLLFDALLIKKTDEVPNTIGQEG